MEHYVSGMPLWAIVLFVAIFLYTISFIASPAKRAALNAGLAERTANRVRAGIWIFYVGYLAYVAVLSLYGVFDVNSIPPKVMVWAGFPLLIILFVFIGNTALFKKIAAAASLESLVALHIFRLAGVFFLILYFYHLLPARFALSAESGDILTALLAIPVSRMVAKRRKGWFAAVVAWNVFGILDIVNAIVLAVVIAQQAIAGGTDGGLREMTVFPFVWFPAFAPATILFLHTLVFRKLYQERKIKHTAYASVGHH